MAWKLDKLLSTLAAVLPHSWYAGKVQARGVHSQQFTQETDQYFWVVLTWQTPCEDPLLSGRREKRQGWRGRQKGSRKTHLLPWKVDAMCQEVKMLDKIKMEKETKQDGKWNLERLKKNKDEEVPWSVDYRGAGTHLMQREQKRRRPTTFSSLLLFWDKEATLFRDIKASNYSPSLLATA